MAFSSFFGRKVENVSSPNAPSLPDASDERELNGENFGFRVGESMLDAEPARSAAALDAVSVADADECTLEGVPMPFVEVEPRRTPVVSSAPSPTTLDSDAAPVAAPSPVAGESTENFAYSSARDGLPAGLPLPAPLPYRDVSVLAPITL